MEGIARENRLKPTMNAIRIFGNTKKTQGDFNKHPQMDIFASKKALGRILLETSFGPNRDKFPNSEPVGQFFLHGPMKLMFDLSKGDAWFTNIYTYIYILYIYIYIYIPLKNHHTYITLAFSNR